MFIYRGKNIIYTSFSTIRSLEMHPLWTRGDYCKNDNGSKTHNPTCTEKKACKYNEFETFS